MKKIYGLIGHPVKHSLSTAMHNAAFRALKIDAEYQLFDIKPEDLSDFLTEVGSAKSQIYGLNVTIPHKIAVYELLNDSLSESAKKIGAVNTIIVQEERNERRLIADNTDGYGFLESLEKDLRFDPKDKVIFVLGAGGAARAIIMSLGNLPEKIYFTDIDEARQEALESDYKKFFDAHRIYKLTSKDKANCVMISDLLVNATNVGMKETDEILIEPTTLHKNMYVFDCIYNPKETKLLKCARERGLTCVNGLGMLLYQGAASFRLWTGKEPPIEVMQKALNDQYPISHNQ